MRRLLLAAALAVPLLPVRPVGAKDGLWGVLVMAHGGSRAWNRTVERAVRRAKLPCPVETFYGMAAGSGEREQLARALLRLKQRGAQKILAVPLLVSSSSEVYRQYEYMLGLRPDPGFSEDMLRAMAGMHGAHGHGHGHAMPPDPALPLTPVTLLPATPVYLVKALDDSPELLAVLKDRAREFSRAPGEEAVVLVAHGPNEEQDNLRWLEDLSRLGERLRAEGGYSEARTATLRDDAPPAIRNEATRRLRDAVRELSGAGRRVLVLPVLISAGGIEKGIPARLEGLPYEMGRPLLDHQALSRWIARKFQEAAVPRQAP